MSELTCDSRVLEASSAGDIIEIAFHGVHEWTHGGKMQRFIQQTVMDVDPSPSAVVINLLDYDYEAGNDISGLFDAFMDRKRHRLRPCCIVATGRTHGAMYPFFASARILDTFR